ncbi:MAG: membrane protein insertion efficiency factor YidD [Armatimonadetes bacterium]|nr:membrane protein insertion efficiency factor YidD [Armatimonadota bacterium]
MRYVLIYLIRVYQQLSKFKPRVCRFEPSCSEYAVQAIQKHGALKGIGMTVRRILRCNPWSPGGFDPVK